MNYCNGHGFCEPATDTCKCYEGWGAKTDVAVYKLHDCSGRTCPSGPAWADVASAAGDPCPGGVLGQGPWRT